MWNQCWFNLAFWINHFFSFDFVKFYNKFKYCEGKKLKRKNSNVYYYIKPFNLRCCRRVAKCFAIFFAKNVQLPCNSLQLLCNSIATLCNSCCNSLWSFQLVEGWYIWYIFSTIWHVWCSKCIEIPLLVYIPDEFLQYSSISVWIFQQI